VQADVFFLFCPLLSVNYEICTHSTEVYAIPFLGRLSSCLLEEKMLSADFLLTSFLVAVSPGTGVLYTLSAGLSQGRRASLIAALGCTLAFLPQFMSADEPSPMRHLILLGIAFMAITLIVFVGYGMTAASFRNLVQSRPHVMLWLQRCFAMAFVAMSLKLAWF
jgi:threonine/homoserine/homoserine lactone efflux protein